MTEDELIAKGWHRWYNEKYWVHPDLVEDQMKQDYTNYGMSFDLAVEMEQKGRPKFSRALPIELFPTSHSR